GLADVVRQNSNVLLHATEQLVQQQVGLWVQSLKEGQRTWQETGRQQQQAIAAGLQEALEKTTVAHAERLAQQEQRSRDAANTIITHLHKLTATLSAGAAEQQKSLAELTARVSAQAEVLDRLTENSTQLAQMQDVLQQNLSVLAGAGAFEQAV